MLIADPHLENAVLATCLADLKRAMTACVEAGMPSDVFTSTENRCFYKFLLGLWSNGGEVIRSLIPRDMKKAGVLDECGGHERVSELFLINPAPSALPKLIADLKDSKHRRDLLEATGKAHMALQGDDPTEEIKARLGASLCDDGASAIETPTPNQLSLELVDKAASESAIPTGFDGIDRMCGLMYPGDFLVVGGGAKAGKSVLSANIASHISKTKFVVIFTIELNRSEYWRRMVCAEASVSANFWQASMNHVNFASQQDRVNAALQRLNSRKITIVDRVFEIEQAIAIAKTLKQKHGELGAFVIDYIQMFESAADKKCSRAEKVSYVSRLCKIAAVELRCLAIGVSQLNDDGQSLDSRGIQRDANLMVNINVDEKGNRKVVSAYNRNGPMNIDLPLTPELHFSRFTEC